MNGLEQLAEATRSMREAIEESEERDYENICLGVEIARVINSYYAKDLIEYLKGKSANGSMYFYYLKPLYDEYGYEKVNKTILRIDKEYSENE